MESEIEQALKKMKNKRAKDYDFSQEVDEREKENSHPLLRDKTKTRLQRLGVLYGGGEVSSPIHKSEQAWDEEQDEDANNGDKSPYAERRAQRFQALANTINSWEDDIRHISPKKEQEERIDRFGNIVGSKAVRHETVQIPLKIQNGQQKPTQGQTPKKVAWDRKIINSLEMQGFKRCDSEEHLVYDYISPSSKECLSPTKRRPQLQPTSISQKERSPSPKKVNPKPTPAAADRVRVVTKEPVTEDRSPSSHRPVPVNQSRERSPQRSMVLELAAQYESDSPSPTKGGERLDPALLSVAEKKAVFEKNRGAPPIPQLLPKTRMPSPVRKLPKVAAVLEASRPEGSPVRDNVKQAMIERFQELEALRHRWDRNKALATPVGNMHQRDESVNDEESDEDVSPQTPPPPPPLPPSSFIKRSPPRSSSPPSQIKMGMRSPVGKTSPSRQLPRVLSVKEKTPHQFATGLHYPEVKKITVSPPKPGHLYPSISDIEADSEVPETDLDTIDEEYMDEDDQGQDSFMASSSLETSINSESSFGREIVRQASKTNLKRPSHSFEESSSSGNESKILREMDDLLDEALGSPSPKRARDSNNHQDLVSISDSCSTNSFEFSEIDQRQEVNQPKDDVKTPLIHSISVYRRQQNQPVLTPVRKEVRREVVTIEDEPMTSEESEEELAQKKIKELTIEMQRQIETVSQASKALNLCLSTPGFIGSTAEVEAQKLLLVASARWTSLKQEIERLRVEKRVRAVGCGLDRGDITIQSISVPLKTSYISSREHSQANLVCLVRTGCSVLQTEVIAIDKGCARSGRVNFQKILNLVDLYSDFTASVEVYGFMAQRPSDIAVPEHKGKSTPSKKGKNIFKKKILLNRRNSLDKGRTFKKQKDKDKFLPVESPAGPNAVRSSAFQMWGFAVFSLREVNRSSFSLSKVPYTCPLEGSIEISMNSSMQSQVEHRGFLTVYEDVSGFGAWKRRWAELKGSSLAFWTYPEHCREGKVAVDTIDLTAVSTVEASLAPRDICARPHTILLESQLRDSRLPESLVVRKRGDITVVMHLLSADTKEERLAWCKQINKVLHLLRAWKVNCATAV